LAIEQTPMTTETPIIVSTPLVSLTPKATDKLREVLSKQDRQDLALRVYVTPGGCSGFSYGMTFAEGTEEDDAIIEQDGVRVVVDPMSAMYLKGSEIDFVDALMGGGFALRNPNAGEVLYRADNVSWPILSSVGRRQSLTEEVSGG